MFWFEVPCFVCVCFRGNSSKQGQCLYICCMWRNTSGSGGKYRYSVLCVSKKLYTFEIAAENKIYDSGGKGLDVWIANGLNFHMTSKSLKIIYAWVSTAHWAISSRHLGLNFVSSKFCCLSQTGMLIPAQPNFHTLYKSEQGSPKHKLFLDFLVSYESWVHKLFIHMNLLPQNHILFIEQPFQKCIVLLRHPVLDKYWMHVRALS